jgi:hypothetical protein
MTYDSTGHELQLIMGELLLQRVPVYEIFVV